MDPQSEPPILVEGLRKRIAGREILKGVSFRVERGEILALVGPNGAGKTTTLRVLAGIYRYDSGTVRVLGWEPRSMPREARRRLAYLPEDAQPYRYLTGREFAALIAEVYGVEDVESYVGRVAEISGLGEKLEEQTGGYSKGMKRRLLLAVLLALEPAVAILDEPTSGLDVEQSVRVRRMIKEYVAESGSTVVLSSHNMLEVEYLSDRVALIHDGRIVYEGGVREVVEAVGAENLEEAYLKIVEAVVGGAGP